MENVVEKDATLTVDAVWSNICVSHTDLSNCYRKFDAIDSAIDSFRRCLRLPSDSDGVDTCLKKAIDELEDARSSLLLQIKSYEACLIKAPSILSVSD